MWIVTKIGTLPAVSFPVVFVLFTWGQFAVGDDRNLISQFVLKYHTLTIKQNRVFSASLHSCGSCISLLKHEWRLAIKVTI